MNKHISVWCQPRSGSSAYCNHLKTTGKVFTDVSQEFMSAHTFWPMLKEPGIEPDTFNISFQSYPDDNEVKEISNNDPFRVYKTIRNRHNPNWIWTDWKLTERGIKPFYNRSIPTHCIEDTKERTWAQDLLSKSKVSEAIKLYDFDEFNFQDIKYDTVHHLLIRDPLDTALSQVVAYTTMVWHQESNDESKVRIKDTISFNPNENKIHERTPYEWAEHCHNQNINMLETLGDKVDCIVKYEDIDFKNNRFKKMHTLQEKLDICNDLHFLDDMRNNYNKRLDSLL
mgnify:FL=1